MRETQLQFELENTHTLFIKVLDEIDELLWQNNFKNQNEIYKVILQWKENLINEYPVEWNENTLHKFTHQISQWQDDVGLFQMGYPAGFCSEPCLQKLYLITRQLKNNLWDKLLDRFIK